MVVVAQLRQRPLDVSVIQNSTWLRDCGWWVIRQSSSLVSQAQHRLLNAVIRQTSASQSRQNKKISHF
jgi:hypothetical protein